MRTMWLKTQDLHRDGKPLSLEGIREEVRAQGIDRLIFHLFWSHYMHFSFQRKSCGVNVEIFRTPHGYIFRTHGRDWSLMAPESVKEVIRRALEHVCN